MSHAQLVAAFEGKLCRLTLMVTDRNCTRTSTDFFEAMRLVRLQLEAEGCYLVCNGASERVWPSGMSRSMCGGAMAYKLAFGQKSSEADLVNIFHCDPSLTPATVKEQTAFHDQWLKSVGCDGKRSQCTPVELLELIVERWFTRSLLILLALLAAYHLWNLR